MGHLSGWRHKPQRDYYLKCLFWCQCHEHQDKAGYHLHRGSHCEIQKLGMVAPACRVCSLCLMARVEESSSKLLEAERRLQEERQRAVLLEQHLEKLRLEPSRALVSQKAPKNKPGRSPVGDMAPGVGGHLCSSLVSVGSSVSLLWGPSCPVSHHGSQRLRSQWVPSRSLSMKGQCPCCMPSATIPHTSCQSLCLALDQA